MSKKTAKEKLLTTSRDPGELLLKTALKKLHKSLNPQKQNLRNISKEIKHNSTLLQSIVFV